MDVNGDLMLVKQEADRLQLSGQQKQSLVAALLSIDDHIRFQPFDTTVGNDGQRRHNMIELAKWYDNGRNEPPPGIQDGPFLPTQWPEHVGKRGDEVYNAMTRQYPQFNVVCVNANQRQTKDRRMDRVRIIIDNNGIVDSVARG